MKGFIYRTLDVSKPYWYKVDFGIHGGDGGWRTLAHEPDGPSGEFEPNAPFLKRTQIERRIPSFL